MELWWLYGKLAMTKGADVFKTGIAVAPVTNWRYYDSIYTERFYKLHKKILKVTTKIHPQLLVKLLKGKFLLIHGTADDNVHFQNSMEFSEALIQNNKQFEFMVSRQKSRNLWWTNQTSIV